MAIVSDPQNENEDTTLIPWQTFGEDGLLGSSSAKSSFVAKSFTTLLKLERDALEKVMVVTSFFLG